MTSILTTSSYSNDFIYITQKGRESLCAQTQSSRVILVRPSFFLRETPYEMKNFVNTYCSKLFAFENSVPKFLLLDDANSTNYEVYQDSNVIIRDARDMAKKDLFRQLIFKKNTNEVESEVRLYNVPEKDSKSTTLRAVKTNSSFKAKKQRSCLDENVIVSHFIKIVCSSMYFINCSGWKVNPIEVLVIGGSVGTLPYFLKSIFKAFINITVIERNEKLKELGEQYFGFGGLSTNWQVNSYPISYVQSLHSKLHNGNLNAKQVDLLIVNESNYFYGEKISPSAELVSKAALELYRDVLSNSGVLIMNLASNSNKIFNESLDNFEVVFSNCLTLENSEYLHKVVIGLKDAELTGRALLSDRFLVNEDRFRKEVDIHLLSRCYEKLVGKLIYRRDKKLGYY